MRSLDVLELRQYTLVPGQRDTLIELFDRELVDGQEADGIRVLGQFRDLDAPDRFVWLRGFPDMSARREALSDFYGGPVWARHRDAANATMLDSDDVFLLKPLPASGGYPGPRRPAGTAISHHGRPTSLVTATVYPLAGPPSPDLRALLTSELEPLLRASGAESIALLESETTPNDFPRLPVREGEPVLVRLARFADVGACTAALARCVAAPEWAAVQFRLQGYLCAPPLELRLQPTSRSLLR